MKKPVKLLLQGGALTLLTVSFNANAQHLPNYGFNDWKTECGNTYGIDSKTGYRQRPGIEPTSWNGSSVNQTVGLNKTEVLLENDNGSVKLQNKYVGVTFLGKKIGSVAPGYITFGTPWVYAEMNVSNCDGGTFGGLDFGGYKPEALQLKVKRNDGVAEDSYAIAYLWNGTFTSKIGKKGSPTQAQDNCDRAILGYATDAVSGDGKLVANLTHTFKESANGDWETLTIPFEYIDNSGNTISYSEAVYGNDGNVTAPTMMNVIICCGNYRAADRANDLHENVVLLVDDVDFVYPTQEHQGKIVAVDLATDEAGSADANASDWYDATMSVEDWGNIVDQTEDKKGNYSSEGRVTLHSEHGDVVLDNVKITHHDDYIWLEHSTASTTLEGSLHNDGTYMVYYDVNPAAAANVAQTAAVDQTKPYRVKFLDTESASTTGIEEINGEAVKAVVFGGQGYVSVNGVDGVVSIYSLTGAKLAETYVDGEAVIAAPAGVAIVAYPGGAVKTVVK